MYAFRTRFPHLPILGIAALFVAVLIFLAAWTGHNGLLEPSAHDFLRAVAEALSRPALAIVPGLRVLSWLAVLVAIVLFDRNLTELMPGTRPHVRWLYSAALFLPAPAFIHAGSSVSDRALALVFLLAATRAALRLLQRLRWPDVLWAGLFAGLGIGLRPELALILAPVLVFAAFRMHGRDNLWLLPLLCGSLLAGLAPALWAGMPGAEAFDDWSLRHFFQPQSMDLGGGREAGWINYLYPVFPFFHPVFCLLLPGLLMFAFRTDWWLPSRRALLAGLAVWIAGCSGMPDHALAELLPAYVIALLLLFPAWDRLVSYGEFFLPRILTIILSVLLLTQWSFSFLYLRPLFEANRREQQLAGALQACLPSAVPVYGDVALAPMQTYLPEQRWHLLPTVRDASFPAGSFLVADGSFSHREWTVVRQLPAGWYLYRVPAPH